MCLEVGDVPIALPIGAMRKSTSHVILLVNTFTTQKAAGEAQEFLFSELVPLVALRTDM